MRFYLLHKISIIRAIISSGNRVAYLVLLYKVIALIVKPIDALLSVLGVFFKAADNKPSMIFIVGSHRSGATFISQVLAEQFPFYSIGNFNSLFPKSSYLIHKLFKPNVFKCKELVHHNYYGQTAGLFEINDAHEVWDQWYSGDHSTIPENLSIDVKKNMFSYFSKLYSSVGVPIISKSGRNSLNIFQLDSIFDNGFFIVIDRNLEDIVISTLRATSTFKGGRKGWGIKVDDTHICNDNNDQVTSAVIQCIKVKNKIRSQLRKIDKSKYIVVDYKIFCNDTEAQLQLIINAFALVNKFKYKGKICNYPKFKASSCVDKKLINKVQKTIRKYDYMIER
jgi:hypothetical protein